MQPLSRGGSEDPGHHVGRQPVQIADVHHPGSEWVLHHARFLRALRVREEAGRGQRAERGHGRDAGVGDRYREHSGAYRVRAGLLHAEDVAAVVEQRGLVRRRDSDDAERPVLRQHLPVRVLRHLRAGSR